MLALARRPGERTWHATIMVGVGTDESIDQVNWQEFTSAQDARVWIDDHLPVAERPDWAADYPHHGGGVFLWGWVQQGYYSHGGNPSGGELDWEPDLDVPSFDGDLVEGRVRWRRS